jgi:hypothetical protein
MDLKPVGSLWLQKYFSLKGHTLTRCSYIGGKNRIELNANGVIDQFFGPKYSPTSENPIEHLLFLLRYDDLNLDFLLAVFHKLDVGELRDFIKSTPSTRYGRRLGFLYEFLTREKLDPNLQVYGNYVDLLDDKKYFTGIASKNSRWRINNNLLGTENFCPIIRKTDALQSILKKDLFKQFDELKRHYTPEILQRATNYLYTKETRSSFEIEKEKPSPQRTQRFIALLTQAGKQSQADVLDEKQLTKLQNEIVDERFKASGFRDFQNYIGQTMPRYDEIIHYICPPPHDLSSLMYGLKASAGRMKGIPPIIRASIIAFGFVFIHPFEDGNGRIHRFLIHDSLTRDGIVPQGFIIPVSAHMLNHMTEYDQALEKYSKPLMKRILYAKNADGQLEITNKMDVEGYFRYPDLTTQTIYLANTMFETIHTDLPEELEFIQHYDEVKTEMQNIVDMPDKQLNLMILFLHHNHGTFPKRRRNDFEKLTDEEINQMERIYQEIFNITSVS